MLLIFFCWLWPFLKASGAAQGVDVKDKVSFLHGIASLVDTLSKSRFPESRLTNQRLKTDTSQDRVIPDSNLQGFCLLCVMMRKLSLDVLF